MNSSLKETAKSILAGADIEVGGKRPWDITVHDERFWARVLGGGSLALGESYMDGWWDAEALDQFFYRVLKENLGAKVRPPLKVLLDVFIDVVRNPQARTRAFAVGEHHYDIGNDLYRAMLDKRLTYTCGYWSGAKNLDEAQEAKLDLVCKKLRLKPGEHILDIGCGWGSFMKYAAENYGATSTGITVSKEQIALGKELCAALPVEFRLQDYRDVEGTFDHIVSLGMFEHVGYKNYRTFMRVVHDHLKNGGLFLLHTIGGNKSSVRMDPWIGKYIFPNSMIPSIKQIGAAIEGLFIMEDWHNFGAHYDLTLMSWFHNFDAAWPRLKDRYGERFYRMWKYYLLSCAGLFRARKDQLWQIVLSKKGVAGGYQSIR